MKISSAYLLHCHGSFVQTLKEVFQRGNFQLRPRKSVRCKEVSTKNCPLCKGFLIRTLYETNPFLKKCLLEGDVRYGGFPLERGSKYV